jgi:phosphoinositide-3-kinase regulatory subunit 4
VAFQLLLAAAQIHSRGVVHGDIKSENVLLTSWEWLFLADFAAGLKPVALPADNPVGGGGAG